MKKSENVSTSVRRNTVVHTAHATTRYRKRYSNYNHLKDGLADHPVVKYHVVMEKNIGTEKDPMWVQVYAKGIVRNTSMAIGAIFRQNPRLLDCTKVVRESYYPL